MRSQMGVHILVVCTRRLLRLVFLGWLAARDAPRRRRPGQVPTRKTRLANGPRMSRTAGGGAGRGHLDEARSRPAPYVPRPGNSPAPLVHPSAPGRSGAPAGARLAGSAIERRVVWAMSRPGNSIAPPSPSSPVQSGSPAGVRLTGSVIERRLASAQAHASDRSAGVARRRSQAS